MSLQAVRRQAEVTGQVDEYFIKNELDWRWDLEEAFAELERHYQQDGLPNWMYRQVEEELIDLWDTVANDPEHLER